MKVAYISPSFMSDVDLSFIGELQKYVEIDYYLQLSPYILKSSAICIEKQIKRNGVLPAKVYPELKKMMKIIPENNFYVVNDLGKHSYSLSSIICYIELYMQILKKKYDIVHFTWPFNRSGYIMYFLRDKMIMTVHDPFPHSSQNNKYHNLIRNIAFKNVSNFIVLNKAQKENFIKYYRLQNKNVYSSSLSSYTYLHAYENPDFKLQPNKKYFLMFGNILSHKGADYLLEAFEEVHVNNPEVKLIIAGRWKWNYGKLNYYKSKDYVEILDRFIPDEELAKLIQQSYCCVTPYIDATQSGVIMSSFAYYKPCIATNVGGLPEMVIHDYYGLIIPPQNKKELIHAINYLLKYPEKIIDYSSNIKKDYHRGLKSWEMIVQGMLKIYCDTLNKK